MKRLSRSDIRKINMDNDILTMIRKMGKLSKFDLSKLCGYSISTTITVIEKLFAEQKIINMGSENLTVGRPAVYYSINPSAGFFIGIEIYQSGLICTAMDYICANKMTIEKNICQVEVTPEYLTATIIEVVNEMLKNLPAGQPGKQPNIMGIGLSIPAIIDNNSGQVVHSKQFPLLNGHSITKAIEEHFSVPFFIDDVVNSMCLACKWINFENVQNNFALLYVRRGIRVSYIYNLNFRTSITA